MRRIGIRTRLSRRRYDGFAAHPESAPGDARFAVGREFGCAAEDGTTPGVHHDGVRRWIRQGCFGVVTRLYTVERFTKTVRDAVHALLHAQAGTMH